VDFNGKPASMATLAELVRQVGTVTKDITVVIRSDENTPLRYVTEAMDVCRKQGLNKIRLQSR
jgi:biopolymer transport protein ExbD